MKNAKIIVKFIDENKYGFVKGKIYQAYEIQSAFPNKHKMICVIDDFGEEYAYPREWFDKEKIDENLKMKNESKM